jgi:rare lipoprotein A
MVLAWPVVVLAHEDSGMPDPGATPSSDAEKPLSAQRSAIDLLSSDEDEEGEEEAEVLPSETGLASWYGPGFHKRRTASGERFDMHAMTAAHRTLPFGTMVCVRSQITGEGGGAHQRPGPARRQPGGRPEPRRCHCPGAAAWGKPVDVFPLSTGEDTCPPSDQTKSLQAFS